MACLATSLKAIFCALSLGAAAITILFLICLSKSIAH